MADIYQQCQMSVRRVLRGSTNADIQHLYAVTSSKNVNINAIKNGITQKLCRINVIVVYVLLFK